MDSDASMARNEVLVVGYKSGEGRSSWPVVAEVTPLVTVLRASFDDLPLIADHSRLAFARRPDGGTERAGDESALDELDEGARIFVSAWLARPATKPERPGEGLSWDAPGFEPP
jgi:hypothetical protein